MSGTIQASAIKDSASATTNLTLDTSGNVSVGNNLTVTNNITVTGSMLSPSLTTPTISNPNITTGFRLNGSSGTSGQILTSAGSGLPTWSNVVTSGGATTTNPMSANVTLTASSNRVQVFAPSAQGYTITLPDATTLSAAGGPVFELINNVQECPIAVLDSSGANVGWVVSDYTSSVYLTSTATATGNWVIKTGNPSADGGVYPYDATFPATSSATLSSPRNFGLGFDKNNFMGSYGRTGTAFNTDIFSGSLTNRSLAGTPTTSGNCGSSQYQYSMCPVSSSMYFVIYQNITASQFNCYVVSLGANGSFTKGTELSINATNNQGYPICRALNSTTVLVYFNGNNASNYATAQVITISGTTLTNGASLGNTSNVIGANLGVNTDIAWLSSTLVHLTDGSKIYSLSVSGTTLSLAGSVNSPAGTIYGVVPVSATQSMVFYNNSSGSIVGAIATDSSGTITFGSASSPIMVASSISWVSQINTNVALVQTGFTSGSQNAENKFSLVKNISGTITTIGRGILPTNIQGQFFILPQSGVAMVPVFTGVPTSSNYFYAFKKVAITGAV